MNSFTKSCAIAQKEKMKKKKKQVRQKASTKKQNAIPLDILLSTFEPTDIFRKKNSVLYSAIQTAKMLNYPLEDVISKVNGLLQPEFQILRIATGEYCEGEIYSAIRDVETLLKCAYGEEEFRKTAEKLNVTKSIESDDVLEEQLAEFLETADPLQNRTFPELVSLTKKMRATNYDRIDSWLLLNFLLAKQNWGNRNKEKSKQLIASAIEFVFNDRPESTQSLM